MAQAVISRAEEDGRLKPGDTVVEYTGGSTGASLALVCAAKGYPLVVTMADSFSIERRKLSMLLLAQDGEKLVQAGVDPADAVEGLAVGVRDAADDRLLEHGILLVDDPRALGVGERRPHMEPHVVVARELDRA